MVQGCRGWGGGAAEGSVRVFGIVEESIVFFLFCGCLPSVLACLLQAADPCCCSGAGAALLLPLLLLPPPVGAAGAAACGAAACGAASKYEQVGCLPSVFLFFCVPHSLPSSVCLSLFPDEHGRTHAVSLAVDTKQAIICGSQTLAAVNFVGLSIYFPCHECSAVDFFLHQEVQTSSALL